MYAFCCWFLCLVNCLSDKSKDLQKALHSNAFKYLIKYVESESASKELKQIGIHFTA